MPEQLPSPAELLPHSGLALVLHELTSLEPGKSATGLWTPDERYYEGHFGILPGHWIEESVNLVAACAAIAGNPGVVPKIREHTGKFLRQVELKMPPEDLEVLEVTADFSDLETTIVTQGIITIARGSGRAFVDGKKVYTAGLIEASWINQHAA